MAWTRARAAPALPLLAAAVQHMVAVAVGSSSSSSSSSLDSHAAVMQQAGGALSVVDGEGALQALAGFSLPAFGSSSLTHCLTQLSLASAAASTAVAGSAGSSAAPSAGSLAEQCFHSQHPFRASDGSAPAPFFTDASALSAAAAGVAAAPPTLLPLALHPGLHALHHLLQPSAIASAEDWLGSRLLAGGLRQPLRALGRRLAAAPAVSGRQQGRGGEAVMQEEGEAEAEAVAEAEAEAVGRDAQPLDSTLFSGAENAVFEALLAGAASSPHPALAARLAALDAAVCAEPAAGVQLKAAFKRPKPYHRQARYAVCAAILYHACPSSMLAEAVQGSMCALT